jgi:hypothetical protein
LVRLGSVIPDRRDPLPRLTLDRGETYHRPNDERATP